MNNTPIERLAEFMGWEVEEEVDHDGTVDSTWLVDNKKKRFPMEDWNDWRLVEEKIANNKDMCWKFQEALGSHPTDIDSVDTLMKSTLEQRCMAALATLPTEG